MARRYPLALPVLLAGALVSVALLASVRAHPRLMLSMMSAALALAAWAAALAARTSGGARALSYEVVVRKQHYVQASAQATVLLYWGWYWPQVYQSLPLILAQLLFAYAFDMLLSWSRRDVYTLGFGPFPVVFTIKLFIWFNPEW
jgi:hypothetical protein